MFCSTRQIVIDDVSWTAFSGGPVDLDGDGFTDDLDCDDSNASVYPGAPEICDGLDNNCNTVVDEGLVEICGDGIDNDCDGDVDEGFDLDGDGYASCEGDCNDNDATINPGAAEICGDGIDNNCNAEVDEGGDADGDGYTTCDGDCDDNDAAINPGAAEICDGIDNDCDGDIDTDDSNLVDNVPPTISCSGNMTQNTDPGLCGAQVSIATPATNDNCTVLLLPMTSMVLIMLVILSYWNDNSHMDGYRCWIGRKSTTRCCRIIFGCDVYPMRKRSISTTHNIGCI